MGTRNLTAVYVNGEYKVAQYGQWDGYPSGQGITCLEFLRDKMDEHKFRDALGECSYITDSELEALWSKYTKSKDGWATLDEAYRMKADYPELSRDTGADILELIQNGGARKLNNNIVFAADGLFCEWAWVIDLDKRTFEAYEGFQHSETTENDRFYFLKDKEENGYSVVKLCATFDLDNLPSNEDFLAAFKTDEDE